MLSLSNTPVTELKGVGAKLAEKLAHIQINNLQDLLFHLPLRYQDRTRISPMGSLLPGDDVVLEGVIKSSKILFGKRRSLQVRIQDHTGTVSLRFFHFNASQKNSLSTGKYVRAYGEARRGASGLELYHPEYQIVEDDSAPLQDKLTPVYPTTEGLHQNRLRQLMEQALEFLHQGRLEELLPADFLHQQGLPSLEQAVSFLHHPSADTSMESILEGQHPAQHRLAFEELLAHHLSLYKIRDKARSHGAPPLPAQENLTRAFLKQLPFALTSAQQRVATEISSDQANPYPMLRLVQGDVGSGKTVVAALAALQAVENDYQAAIMAPTEILAEQHYINFRNWLEPLGLKVAWLSGKQKGKARQEHLESVANGSAQVVVGTHALFQDEVMFSRLGTLIVDEQHRFGVHQRLSLREKGNLNGCYPHQLIMTATPIPRTLAMSAYADLDTSIIDELPPGRTPVNTVVIPDTKRPLVVERVNQACADGRQAYWVCTLVEESEALQCQAAEVTAAQLTEALPNLKIGLVHGRMKSKEKVEVMQAFKNAELDLLVATTVIEVGVDVPNASLMIIENPERLGLAQLHQLRGRVGRGSVASHCLLMVHSPLSDTAKQRIGIMRETNDGFKIAEKDLEIRGPGEVLGIRQTGLAQLRVADLERDADLLPLIKQTAELLSQQYPHVIDPLIQRWLGNSEVYGNV